MNNNKTIIRCCQLTETSLTDTGSVNKLINHQHRLGAPKHRISSSTSPELLLHRAFAPPPPGTHDRVEDERHWPGHGQHVRVHHVGRHADQEAGQHQEQGDCDPLLLQNAAPLRHIGVLPHPDGDRTVTYVYLKTDKCVMRRIDDVVDVVVDSHVGCAIS